LASFATAGVAAVAAVSMAAWYALVGLQWTGEQTKAAAPARPVNRLSDAAWAGRAEVIDRFSTPGGIVLGELTDPRRKFRFDPAVPKRWGRQGKGPLITLDPAAGNAHSLVFSGSGSFKTVGIAIPNALTFAGSLIVIDPKGEIHAATSAVRSARGRKPWLVTEEDGLDPIRLLTAARPNDGTVFDSIAEFLLPQAGDEKADSSTFFHQKAVRLLSALLGHLYYTKEEGTDLFMAANRILAFEPDALKARFEEAAEVHSEYPDREFIHVGLSEVGNTEPRQLSGVTATAANGLSWAGHASTRGFLAAKLRDCASKPPDGEALLARVLDDNTDIYFRIPTPVLQANPGIARVLIGSLVRVLRDSAMEADKKAREDVKDPKAPKADAKAPDLRKEKSGPALGDDGEGGKDGAKPPERKQRSRRLFLIDEARAMRRMDTLAAVRDEGRAYGIHLLQIFQSWQQVLECYGHHGAGAWANSVDAVVIGPVSDARQAQELSRMVGRHTVVTSSTSKQRNAQMFMPFSGTAGSSESTQLRELDLIQPSELRQIPPEAAIILAVGTAPIMASKAIWFTRADMTRLVDQAKSSSTSENPRAEASVPVAEDVSGEVEAAAAETDAEDSPAPEPVKEQGVTDTPVSHEGAGDPPDMAAGQGRFQPAGDVTGTGVDAGAVAEQPSGGVEEGNADTPPQAARGLGAQIHEIEFGDLGRVAGQLWLGLDDAGRAATVILASTEEIRAEINDTVRKGLAAEEVLHGREFELHRLISRGMTPAQKADIRNWAEGDAAVFRSDLRGGKARKGECFTVVAIEGDHAILAHDDGREFKVQPGSKSLSYQVELYEPMPICIRAGDHVRWTRDDLHRGLVSGQCAAILGVGPKAVRLETEEGRELRLLRDDGQLRHFDHAYSSPVHGAQGISGDQVIAVINSGFGNLADQAAFCVEACRDRNDFVVLTDNRRQLVEMLEAAGECPGDGGPEATRTVVLADKERIPPAGEAFTTPRESDDDLLANVFRGSGDDGGVAADPDVFADENAIARGDMVIGPHAVNEPPRAAGEGAAEANREEIPTPVERGVLRSLGVLEMAAAWYRNQLQGNQGAAVRAYLKGRGFDAESQGRRGFGYAPRKYGALSAAFKAQGVTVDELIAAGLVGRNEKDGSTYDRFRDRLMFPIEDEDGRCIAFGGRTMNSKAMATFLNSPQTRIFY
ncbi:MAG: type IV secretory system conjugative DNA transfer family protein, partial [Gemmatimonadetes bacterium]|nr:type IV secretory system conjugative DNA transfer family protein [Gemmatimonadota bacterium]